MTRRIVALLVMLCMTSPAVARPGASRAKILVLPLDGSAPAETRKKLSASFQKMARVLDGDVQAGNTSLGDTATAIGCDPVKPSCVENVRATLGVDELVYGTADESEGTITVVAKRYRKSKPVRELSVSQASTEPPNKIEPQLLPVFGEEPLPPDTTTTIPDPNSTTEVTDPSTTTAAIVPDPNAQEQPPERPPSSNRDRNISIAITAAGGGLFVLGLSFWLSASSLQDDIDNASTRSSSDFERLKDLEDKASTRAWTGNILVVAGLAVAGYGGYRLWQRSKSKAVVTPSPTEGGAAVTLTVVGDLW